MAEEKNIVELNDEDLESVTGGAGMEISEKSNTITVFMDEGSYSINYLFAGAEQIILRLGGANAWDVCFRSIRPALNTHKDKITKCVIDTNTFIPTYFVGDQAYTQSEVDNW